jgi:hypothetical protein
MSEKRESASSTDEKIRVWNILLFRLRILPIESVSRYLIQMSPMLMWERETRLSSYMAIPPPLIFGVILFRT